jgi:hypothetical protein
MTRRVLVETAGEGLRGVEALDWTEKLQGPPDETKGTLKRSKNKLCKTRSISCA